MIFHSSWGKCAILVLSTLLLIHADISLGQQRWYSKTTTMPSGRQMYGAAILGDNLYLIGGNGAGGYIKSVIKAPVGPDGKLGAWSNTTDLPHPRAYIGNSTFALNDIVYVVAGWDGVNDLLFNTILWSRPRADGQLEAWRESMPYPGEGVNCGVAIPTSGYIHLIGGQGSGNTVHSNVWSARVASDGSITGWEPGPPLPTPLWFHCGGVAAGRVWVWGGLTGSKNDSTHPVVYTAAIQSSGKLAQWQTATGANLTQPFYSASSVVTGNYLLSFCPRYTGGQESNDVWFASASAQGLGKWQKLETDLPSKMYIGLGTDYRRGFVYIPGGRISPTNHGMDNNVYFFQLAGSTSGAADSGAGADETVTMDATSGAGSRLSYTQVSVGGAHKGFVPFDQGRQMALSQRKPIILYFFNDKARRCAEQKSQLDAFNASDYASRVVFAEVDTVKFPQAAQQYGVFKIPHWIAYDAAGNTVMSHTGVMPPQQIGAMADRLTR